MNQENFDRSKFRLTYLHSPSLGRTFNHVEDLVFFYGSAGAKEAVSHLMEISNERGCRTVRFKWDGGVQVFWGREYANGPLVIATHNSWKKGIKSYSEDDIYQFIVSGNLQLIERQLFARQFASLYNYLEQATPISTVGFYYADVMYLTRPMCINQTYQFTPNRKSKTCYCVNSNSHLGYKISKSQVFLAGHGYYRSFGDDESLQDPEVTFDHFNYIPEIVIHNPIYNQTLPAIDYTNFKTILELVNKSAVNIDHFLAPTKGLSDLREIIYKYVNYCAKQQQLHALSKDSFFTWLKKSKVSLNKQDKIEHLNKEYNSALDDIFLLVKCIQDVKNSIIDQLEQGHTADIWDINGEGRVRYADNHKQFGHIKLVPRHRWTPQ